MRVFSVIFPRLRKTLSGATSLCILSIDPSSISLSGIAISNSAECTVGKIPIEKTQMGIYVIINIFRRYAIIVRRESITRILRCIDNQQLSGNGLVASSFFHRSKPSQCTLVKKLNVLKLKRCSTIRNVAIFITN